MGAEPRHRASYGCGLSRDSGPLASARETALRAEVMRGTIALTASFFNT